MNTKKSGVSADQPRSEASGTAKAVTDANDYSFAVDLMQFLVVPTFVLDNAGKVLIWNKACEKLTGIPAAEVVGTKEHWRGFYSLPRPCLCDLILHDRLDEIEALYAPRGEASQHTYGVHAENWCVMPRLGTELYLAIDVGPLFDADGKLIAVVETLRDMTAQKRAQTELERLATHDGLTGIVNRRGFDEAIVNEWGRAARDREQISLLMVDVDHFKMFNDAYGHQAGDDCLKSIAKVLAESVSRPADLVARYGGEEFTAILNSTDLRGALTVAERIRTGVVGLSITNGTTESESPVTVSIGVATAAPDQDQRHFELLARADQALYKAKRDGRNRVVASDFEISLVKG